METIACPACGTENSIVRSSCEKCGADLLVVKNILNNANKHYNAALEMAQQGRNEEAIVELKAAIELWSKNPNFHNLLGTVYARRGLYDLAIKEWEATLALDPVFEKAQKSIEKARKMELHLQEEIRSVPYKVFAAVAALVGVIAIVVLIVLGFQLQGARSEVEALEAQLSARPDSPDVQQLQLALSRSEQQATSLESRLGTAQQELQKRQEQIDELETKLGALEARSPDAAEKGRLEELRQENEQLAGQVRRWEEEADVLRADAARAEKRLETTQGEVRVLTQRLEASVGDVQSLQAREALVAQAYQLWQQGKYKELLFVLEQMESLAMNAALVADLRGRAEEQIRRLEDPLYRAQREAQAKAAKAKEQEERAYYAGLKLEEAKALERGADWAGAEALLKAALEIDPENAEARSRLVEVQGKIAQREQAVAERLRGAQSALRSSRFEEAIEGFRAVLAARPDHEAAKAGLRAAEEGKARAEADETRRQERIAELSRRASQAAQAGRVEEALQLYRQWRQIAPDDRSVHREIERIERAEQKRVADLNEKFSSGRLRYDERNFEQSIGDFEDALALARLPEEKEKVQAALDIVRQALAEFRQTEQERAEAIATALQEAEAFYRDGALDKAREQVDQALRLDPDNREARRLKRSIEAAQEQKQQEQIKTLESEAGQLEQAGDAAGALKLYQKLLELDPSHRTAGRKVQELREE